MSADQAIGRIRTIRVVDAAGTETETKLVTVGLARKSAPAELPKEDKADSEG